MCAHGKHSSGITKAAAYGTIKHAPSAAAKLFLQINLHQIVDLGLNSVQLVKSDVIIIKGRGLLHAVL